MKSIEPIKSDSALEISCKLESHQITNEDEFFSKIEISNLIRELNFSGICDTRLLMEALGL